MPRDIVIKERFDQYRAEFDELVTLLNAAFRSEGKYDYQEYLRADPRYLELLQSVGVASAFVKAQSSVTITPQSSEEQRLDSLYRPKAIYFIIEKTSSLLSGGFFGTSIGLTFFLGPPSSSDIEILVDNTRGADITPGRSDYVEIFSPITATWYIVRILES